MQTRLWLASAAAAALATTGAFVAGPTLHGQAPTTPPAPTAPFDTERLQREIDEAVRKALAEAGVLRNGELSAELKLDVDRAMEQAFETVRKALDEAGVLRDGDLSAELKLDVDRAMEQAFETVRDIDVTAMVDDAMDGVADIALPGGRPRIGISTRDVTAEEATTAGLSGITGAYVTDVTADSAAGKAGIQAGDIIVSLDGETIRSARQLSRVVAESPDGRALQVTYVRGTARTTVAVTPEVRSPRVMTFERRGRPGRSPEGPVVRQFERRGGPGEPFVFRQGPGGVTVWSGRGRLGVMAQPLSDQLAAYFGVKEGVLVSQVTEASAAAKAGIRAGDVITAVNGKPVKDTGDIIDSLQGVENGKTVPVAITRDRKAQTIDVTMESPSSTSGERVVTRRQRFTA